MNFTSLAGLGILSAACIMTVSARDNANHTRFDNFPVAPAHSREVSVTSDSTFFSIWAPSASQAQLRIYPSGRNSAPEKTVEMTRGTSGLWQTALPGQLYGKFYTFRVMTDDGRWLDETPGIWAKAVGINGDRAAIIDFTTTDPAGWHDDRRPSVPVITDAVIYEMHHRDFSVHPSSGIANKGKFIALTESGTTNSFGDPTGIDHLRQLGVTHVHILPSYDFNSVDETDLPANTYNWGYDPLNYNAPEGSYSTNPSDPAVRIREFKQMVKALHDAGIGVIMDVVYNHTAQNESSNFSRLVPGYFYRQRPDGSWSDASGCGNETASERPMVSDYIVNSVKYWADEYHIDGFRFDLMGIHDTATMDRVADELKKIHPDIFVYGEGWTAGDSPLPADRRALKDNVAMMDGIAVFSDDIRDAIKGHYSKADDRGFATGKPGNEETVKIGIVGATPHPQVDYSRGNNSKKPYAKTPAQVINYVSCHDDLTLTDKLNASMPDATPAERQRAAKLAQTIVFTSQGTPFMFAGEEIFRDKQGVHNSYKSPDSINAINWDLKHDNAALFDYYRNLIALRRSHPAFRMTSADDIARNIVFDKTTVPNLISYSILNHANGDEWDEIKIIFNGSDDDTVVSVPRADWTVIATDGDINPEGLATSRGGKITVPHRSATILARR
ncbi:MAG: type I pullulanase [Muribaculaceae bacterium]|nr:type I pullulanase [Muribaculaceae bacterium]